MKTMRMIVTVPRIEYLTPAEQRATVREALKSTADYYEQRVAVRSLTKVEAKALQFIHDNRPPASQAPATKGVES